MALFGSTLARPMASTTTKIIWFKRLLDALGYPQFESMPIRCDNKCVTLIAHNLVFYEQTEHILIDCHFVHQPFL